MFANPIHGKRKNCVLVGSFFSGAGQMFCTDGEILAKLTRKVCCFLCTDSVHNAPDMEVNKQKLCCWNCRSSSNGLMQNGRVEKCLTGQMLQSVAMFYSRDIEATMQKLDKSSNTTNLWIWTSAYTAPA